MLETEMATRSMKKKARKHQMKIWRWHTQAMSDTEKHRQKENCGWKPSARGLDQARVPAMKRRSFAQQNFVDKVDENESTSQRSYSIEHRRPRGGGFCQCKETRLDMYSKKMSATVRINVAQEDSCSSLEGGCCSWPFDIFYSSSRCFELTLSACRGEVCISMTSTRSIFRISMFVFVFIAYSVVDSFERTCRQTYTHSDVTKCEHVLSSIMTRICQLQCTHSLTFARARTCLSICVCLFIHVSSHASIHEHICSIGFPRMRGSSR